MYLQGLLLLRTATLWEAKRAAPPLRSLLRVFSKERGPINNSSGGGAGPGAGRPAAGRLLVTTRAARCDAPPPVVFIFLPNTAAQRQGARPSPAPSTPQICFWVF